MRTIKLTLAIISILALSAPAFANCGFCYEAAPGFEQCDGTPGVLCRVVFQNGQYLCFDGQPSHGCNSAAPVVAAEQWTVASVETNGIVTAADATPLRTAQLDHTGAVAPTASR